MFTINGFLISSYCNCSMAFPHIALGWSAVSDYGISLTILLRLSPQFFQTSRYPRTRISVKVKSRIIHYIVD